MPDKFLKGFLSTLIPGIQQRYNSYRDKQDYMDRLNESRAYEEQKRQQKQMLENGQAQQEMLNEQNLNKYNTGILNQIVNGQVPTKLPMFNLPTQNLSPNLSQQGWIPNPQQREMTPQEKADLINRLDYSQKGTGDKLSAIIGTLERGKQDPLKWVTDKDKKYMYQVTPQGEIIWGGDNPSFEPQTRRREKGNQIFEEKFWFNPKTQKEEIIGQEYLGRVKSTGTGVNMQNKIQNEYVGQIQDYRKRLTKAIEDNKARPEEIEAFNQNIASYQKNQYERMSPEAQAYLDAYTDKKYKEWGEKKYERQWEDEVQNGQQLYLDVIADINEEYHKGQMTKQAYQELLPYLQVRFSKIGK